MGKGRGSAPSQRQLRVGEELRHVVAAIIARGNIRDPDLENQSITVTEVRVSPDLRNATVLVSIMGDEGRQQLCLRGLANSAGFLQSKVAKRIETRYTPRLTFEIDKGVKKSLEVGRILQEIAQERKQREAEHQASSEEVIEDSASD